MTSPRADYQRAYYLANKERLQAYFREWKRRNRDRRRISLGYAPGEYDRLLAEQNGRCFLCRINPATVADHDHETGISRRPLCSPCNVGLGMLGDDPQLMARAAEYVTAHKPLERPSW